MTKNRITSLSVTLNGRKIGNLSHLPGELTIFTFNQDYIDDPQRPTLSLSFKDVYGNLITENQPRRVRLPPFFANLLPEESLREYLARKAGVKPEREFFLLQALGQDLPGAIGVAAADADRGQGSGERRPVSDDKRPADPAGDDRLRFSLAGIQLKFSARMAADGGLTIPARGIGGNWIVKLPSARFTGVPENEFAMMELARATGLRVPEVKLVDINHIDGLPLDAGIFQGSALAVRRFDRDDLGGRIHMEDFAQVFALYPEEKYERASYRSLGRVLRAETGTTEIKEFIGRLVFNSLIGNADMHLKNWSLLYPQPQTPVLAPAYDLVSAIAFLPDEKLALSLGRSKQMTSLSADELRYFAAKVRLPEKIVLQAAGEQAERFMDVWSHGKVIKDICPATINLINRLLEKIPLIKELNRGLLSGKTPGTHLIQSISWSHTNS